MKLKFYLTFSTYEGKKSEKQGLQIGNLPLFIKITILDKSNIIGRTWGDSIPGRSQ